MKLQVITLTILFSGLCLSGANAQAAASIHQAQAEMEMLPPVTETESETPCAPDDIACQFRQITRKGGGGGTGTKDQPALPSYLDGVKAMRGDELLVTPTDQLRLPDVKSLRVM
jgi:hypothetical protein